MSRTLLSLTLLVASSCGFGFGLVGNGKKVTENRDVAEFTKLDVDSAITVVATTGPRSFTLKTHENVAQYVVSEVVDGTLKLRLRDGVFTMGSDLVRIELASERLEGITADGASTVTAAATQIGEFPIKADGASTVTVTGLSSPTVRLDANGASTVKLSGTADSLKLTANGASTVLSKPLSAKSASLDVNGASTVEVFVTENVSGQANGASTVRLTGPASGTVSSEGASSVHRGE